MAENGQRCGFLAFNAAVELHPLMTPEDLQQASRDDDQDHFRLDLWMPYVSKRILFLIGVVLLLWGGISFGTVKPSLKSLINSSTWVIVGTVTEVKQLDAARWNVTIEPQDVLKGEFVNTWTKRMSFSYQPTGDKEFLFDFNAMKRSGEKCIFMLRTVPDVPVAIEALHIELTDAWFGIEKASPDIIREIRQFVQGNY